MALLIGNQGYAAGVGTLNNTRSDAALVRNALIQAGMPRDAVFSHNDLSRSAMTREIRAFQQRVRAAGPGAISFFYYAGHGAANSGVNYLIPTDVSDTSSPSFWDDCIDLETVMASFTQASDATHLISIDACRNELRLPGRTLTDRGFVPRARDEAATRVSTHTSYSTWAGQPASDGRVSDGNGPYAPALAQFLNDETLSIPAMFREVRFAVQERTAYAQEPMNIDRLTRQDGQLQLRTVTQISSCSPSVASAGRRSLALVIGNSEYTGIPPIDGARRDVERMTRASNLIGFETTTLRNAGLEQMQSALANLRGSLTENTLGMVYFSGHGFAINGVNFLVPSDAHIENSADVERSAIRLDQLINELSGANPNGIILLVDACSVNPFRGDRKQQKTSALTLAGAMAAGIAPIAPISDDVPIIVATASQPGQTAMDSPDGSPFAQALAEEFVSPVRRSALEVLAAVSLRVSEATRGSQRPWFSSQSAANSVLYFRDGSGLTQSSC